MPWWTSNNGWKDPNKACVLDEDIHENIKQSFLSQMSSEIDLGKIFQNFSEKNNHIPGNIWLRELCFTFSLMSESTKGPKT